MYVVCDNSSIIGCEAIGSYNGSLTESYILTIFVLSKYQGNGIVKLIMNTLEQNEFFLRANRIELVASITALDFYKKCGYSYKNNNTEMDNGQIYRLEKLR